MTTEPTTRPLSAEEIANRRPASASLCIECDRGNCHHWSDDDGITQSCGMPVDGDRNDCGCWHITPKDRLSCSHCGEPISAHDAECRVILLATIAAKDARITELEWERIHETDRANLNAVCAESLKSQLHDANRRAFDLNNELGATQNAAQAERVELEAKVRERDGEIAKAIGYLLHATATVTPPSTAPSQLIAMAALARHQAKAMHDALHDAATEIKSSEAKVREAEDDNRRLRARLIDLCSVAPQESAQKENE